MVAVMVTDGHHGPMMAVTMPQMLVFLVVILRDGQKELESGKGA